jgi:hypothetical protein
MERAMQAMADGDEAACRRAVLMKPPHGYSESCLRGGLASARLHRAVREHGVTGQRLRDAGWDRNNTLSPDIPEPRSPAESKREIEMIRGLEWEVTGNVARPKGKPDMFSGNTSGKISVERSDPGWIMVLADPVDDAPPEHLRKFAEGWSIMASAIDATTEQVRAGKLRTILAVNDYFAVQRKEREAKR